jgi:TRAP-type C4-dicarboxylate transport system permease small subunit
VRGAIHRLARTLALLSAAAAAVMMATVSLDVARRTASGRPIPGANELTVLLIVGVIFLGLAEAERTDTHVRMRLLTSRMPERLAAALRVAALGLAVAMLLWAAYATGVRAYRSYVSGEFLFGLARFPIWPARSLIPLGFLAVALETALRCWDALRCSLGRPPSPDPLRGWPISERLVDDPDTSRGA